jgi:hypothetical protein
LRSNLRVLKSAYQHGHATIEDLYAAADGIAPLKEYKQRISKTRFCCPQ